MSPFQQEAATILDIAAAAGADSEIAIILDRRGAIRMMDPTGWSLEGLAAEFGASTAYRITRTPTLHLEAFHLGQANPPHLSA